uniref:Plus3 domain-containing protein n=1 Tax=Meloidogyne javanica TaxID=6303 RepID=A0A915LGW1_MELJA
MEIDNSKKQDNITENILKDEGNPNKEPSTQPIEIVDETSHLDNSQEAPELEMREEVNASPIQGDSDLQIIETDVSTNDLSLDEPIQSTEEMKKIILTQGQLKLLATSELYVFRQTVIGAFVRVNIPGLPSNYSDRVFIDQIIDIIEPLSFQHLWIDRHYRLRFLGDFEIENIVSLKANHDSDVRPWFDCMEAKGEIIPTLRFVRQKANEIQTQLDTLSAKQTLKELDKQKITFTRSNLSQIALNPSTLRSLSKLGFERFRQVVVGCFVCMTAIRKNKPKDCQYHIVRVLDCVEGPRNYKIKNVARVNYQLVLPFYGRYIINWMKSFTTVTEQGFRNWIEDMKAWDEKLPTLDDIQNKAAELQLALNEAENLPSMMELERIQKDEEEKAKRAKLPVKTAKDLENCVLIREYLQKLSNFEDSEPLVKLLTGCFVRLTSSGGSETGFELDKIMSVKLNEQKKNRPADIVLELKFMGTVSLSALIRLVSSTKINEKEFKEWVKKNENDEDDPLPINEFVSEKYAELTKVLGIPPQPYKSESLPVNGSNVSNSVSKIKNDETNNNSINKSDEVITREPFSLQTKDGKLTTINFRKCLMSKNKIFDMMSWDKETLARVVKGFYVRIGARRPEKSSEHQFYVDQITGVSWGGTPYRNSKNLFNRPEQREMSFLGRQTKVQKQVVSSVLTTPGMGQHLWNDSQSDQPRFTPIVQQPTSNNKPTPLLHYFNTPRVEENNNNWKKQTASFISSSASKIQALSDLKPERESWRQHFSSNEFDVK